MVLEHGKTVEDFLKTDSKAHSKASVEVAPHYYKVNNACLVVPLFLLSFIRGKARFARLPLERA